MKWRILDTNVAVSWYLDESFSIQARRWRQLSLDYEAVLIVPNLHFWEVANVLRSYVRRKELDSTLANSIYRTHLRAPLETVEPSRAAVLQTALEYGATAYDAVYITLARTLGIPLLTAERATTPWVQRLGEQAEVIAG